jgi:hypothetical protein
MSTALPSPDIERPSHVERQERAVSIEVLICGSFDDGTSTIGEIP